jgi:hypothetical protein
MIVNGLYAPDEPHSRSGGIVRLDAARYRSRVWATREHLWIDRVSSAWLIRRFNKAKPRSRNARLTLR